MESEKEAKKLVDIYYTVMEYTGDDLLSMSRATHASKIRSALRLRNELGFEAAEKHIREEKTLNP